MSVEVEEEAVNSAYLRYILHKLLFIIFVLNQNVINSIQGNDLEELANVFGLDPKLYTVNKIQ